MAKHGDVWYSLGCCASFAVMEDESTATPHAEGDMENDRQHGTWLPRKAWSQDRELNQAS
jgi:hypothetical protein